MDLFSQVKSLSWVQYLEGKLRANYHLIRRQTSVALRGSWLINAIFHLLTAAPPFIKCRVAQEVKWVIQRWFDPAPNWLYIAVSLRKNLKLLPPAALGAFWSAVPCWSKTWTVHSPLQEEGSDMGKPREPKLNAWDLFKGGTGMHSDKQDTFGNRTLSAWERVQNVRNVEEITVHFSKVAFRSFC